MDSLLLLCARSIVAHHPLPAVPAHLYPVLFQAAFLDGRPLVLQDLVSAWPFPELNFQRLVGRRELLEHHLCKLCVPAVIQAVVTQLQQDLEEPGRNSRCRLRVLDMTGLPEVSSICYGTKALAKACVEVSKQQQEFQRHRSKRHKGCSGAATAAAALWPLGVDVHANLFVNRMTYEILRDALQTGAASPLRLKCREFYIEQLTASETVGLLESLDPSCVRRVSLRYHKLAESSVILPHLSRFPELRSLRLQESDLDMRRPMPELATGIRCLAQQLGMLPGLRELDLGCADIYGNLCQILSDLQAPLESLELTLCSLLPADLTFLSQSFHARALKRLDLGGINFSQSLLEPLQLLLEETSASLLHLDLWHCCLADSHLDELLPTILRCSRLRFLNLYQNSLSTATVKNLLQKTLELPDLRLVVYPIPVDCYRRPPLTLENIFDDPLGEDLEDPMEDDPLDAVSAEISRMLENSRRTDLVWTFIAPNRDVAPDYFSL